MHGIAPLDGRLFAAVSGGLLLVALGGSIAPAVRATAIDPAGLLRR